MSKRMFLTVSVALIALGLIGYVFATNRSSITTSTVQKDAPKCLGMQQLDYNVILSTAVNAQTSWSNIPIEQSNGAVLSGTARNYSYNGSHVVRVDLTITYPGTLIFTEILNSIDVTTFAQTMPPYVPFSGDTILTDMQTLNHGNRLDYRVTLNYPFDAPTGQYTINMKIFGNYE